MKKLEQRLNDKYFGSKTCSIFNQFKHVDQNKVEELQQSFELFIKAVIEYINSCFEPEQKFYETLSVLDNGLDVDEVYNEYCEIKFMFDNMKKSNVNINEQIQSYIASKDVHNSQSTTNKNYDVLCAINDTEKDDLLNKDQDSKEHIKEFLGFKS
ncbi:unnamed protein product [Rotaria magnacalcarata]|uniref:Uncharacterized protein n=1 Tax=Rotaria magnacalcarata TaxID=392030 RepID=A0A8S2KUC2_9BILA|nr:unnamed protein product [Rotaria magnacalcarata]CAF3870766.1 unnamed protein product [Rotaria magnacalcarata]CAF5214112.1 unnamed protein product [Rotaria magnacalcarata]